MDVYQLTLGSQFADPRWLNAAHRARVPVEGNTVLLQGVRLAVNGRRPNPRNLLEAAQRQTLLPAALPDGVLVEVWCDQNGYYVCALADEYDQHEADKAARVEAERLAREALRERRRLEALAFNQALPVPVAWAPGHKDVLSGLSEHSNGDGLNARSVVHVMLRAPITDGRFKRAAGDFLCTSAAGTNGKQWSSQAEAPASAQVTCKACLKLTQRWAPAK
jgi:hypothetical protein